MSFQDHHCPFLNRRDQRCSERFHVGSLEYAFSYCFDRYKACPTYLQLLVERRVRRSEQAALGHGITPSPVTLVPITVSGKAVS